MIVSIVHKLILQFVEDHGKLRKKLNLNLGKLASKLHLVEPMKWLFQLRLKVIFKYIFVINLLLSVRFSNKL